MLCSDQDVGDGSFVWVIIQLTITQRKEDIVGIDCEILTGTNDRVHV